VQHHGLKITFHRNIEEHLFRFSTNIPAFFGSIDWSETDIVAPSDSLSHLTYRVLL